MLSRVGMMGCFVARFAENVPDRQGDRIGALVVAGAVAGGAGDIHVRQELHVEGYLPGAVADRAAQGAGVVGERARLEILGFRLRKLCIRPA